jgi:hypothetical protein
MGNTCISTIVQAACCILVTCACFLVRYLSDDDEVKCHHLDLAVVLLLLTLAYGVTAGIVMAEDRRKKRILSLSVEDIIHIDFNMYNMTHVVNQEYLQARFRTDIYANCSGHADASDFFSDPQIAKDIDIECLREKKTGWLFYYTNHT